MNEMKFRGKCQRGYDYSDGSGWIQGSLLCKGKESALVQEKDIEIYPGTDDGIQTIKDFAFVPVQHETVGLFTEFIDGHGNEVFTGDIVKCTKGRNDLIEFKNGSAWLRYRNVTLHRFVNELEQNIEVIGNIHENEDLL